MFKGIVSLFTSGLIFNPFVLSGIIIGSWCYFSMDVSAIRSLFLMKEFYVAVVGIATIFVFIFSKVYVNNGRNLDWFAMLGKIVVNVLKFFVSFVLIMSFISMITIF